MKEEFQEFVSIAPWTLIFTWVNLLLLFFIMKKLLFKPVTKMLAQREEEVNAMYRRAEEAQKNAERMEDTYTKKLAASQEKASQIMKDATREATLKSEQILSDAQRSAAATLAKAEKQIEQEKKAAISEIKEDIASIAISVAEKVIEKDINESDHERLLEEFIESSGENK